jgi:hypothetical protein
VNPGPGPKSRPLMTNNFYVGKILFFDEALQLSLFKANISVADPDSEVFGPPGSRSFYHQAKIVRKTLIPTVL